MNATRTKLAKTFFIATMPQYLRVRRRRNASTASMLRMEGLMDPDAVNHKRDRDFSQEEAFSGMNLSEENNVSESHVDLSEASLPQRKKMRRSSAIWRHVESTVPSPTNVQFINATLEDDETLSPKRRRTSQKLTLIDNSTISSFVPVQTTTKKTSYKILNPLERMVDDSLKEVIAGSKSAHEHWLLCRNDANFLQDRAKYILWGGAANLLHACALWNDTETASELLLWASAQGVVEPLTQAVDADGNSPYRTAQLVGHDAVADVIASFGGDVDYVYDVYCLDESAPDDDDDSNLSSSAENTDQVKLCHLDGGVGYWDEKGELVVEVFVPSGRTTGTKTRIVKTGMGMTILKTKIRKIVTMETAETFAMKRRIGLE